jgi:hypothetical protein
MMGREWALRPEEMDVVGGKEIRDSRRREIVD